MNFSITNLLIFHCFLSALTLSTRFFETPEVGIIGIIGIFVLPKYENESELVTSDINFNLVSPRQI